MQPQPTMAQALTAEAAGAFLLVLIGNGAGVALAFAGVSTTADGLLVAAFAHGLILCVIINTLGRISGGHVNPAVTLSLASIGKFPWARVPGYLLAQFVGAFAAAFAIAGIFGSNLIAGSVPTLAHGFNGYQGLAAEAVGAFVLVLAVVAVAADGRFKVQEGWAGLIIGLALACGIFLAGVPSGAGLNPALALSPYGVANLLQATVPNGEIPVYLFGPIIGGVIAAFLYRFTSSMPARAGG